jgi:glucokinase
MTQELTDSSNGVGIELRTSQLVAVKVDRAGSVLFRKSLTFDSDEDVVSLVAELVDAVESGTGTFDEFGLAVPGLVDVNSNRVIYSTQFSEHPDLDLAAEIAQKTGKRVYLENDANAAAYAEFNIGAGKGSNDLFYVTVGNGIGGAFIFDGKLRHGVSGFAGEFGYVASSREEDVHLEDVASAAGIVRRAKNRLHQDPTSSLYEIGEDELVFSDILEAAKNEDGLAELILERTGGFLGVAIANVINLLNIERIVIGGELMQVGDLVLGPIKTKAAHLSFEPGFDLVRINKGKLGNEASAIGAAMLVMDRSG